MLATGGGDGTIILWDVSSGNQLATLQGHSERVEFVSFSPDGSILASGDWRDGMILWDVSSRSQLATLQGHTWGGPDPRRFLRTAPYWHLEQAMARSCSGNLLL